MTWLQYTITAAGGSLFYLILGVLLLVYSYDDACITDRAMAAGVLSIFSGAMHLYEFISLVKICL